MSDFDFTSTAYNAQLAEKKLMGSRCKKCGHTFLPPRALCSHCHSSEMEPFEFSGKGKLAAYTVIYFGPTSMKNAGYDSKNPYCAGIVDLEEGPRISAQIFGVDIAHPEAIQIGSPLTAEFFERGEGESKKVFLGFKA